MYNKIDLREVPAERLKEISLDLVDIDVKAPEFEPNRQFYFMAKARDYVKRKSAELGRPMTFFTQTFGCKTVLNISIRNIQNTRPPGKNIFKKIGSIASALTTEAIRHQKKEKQTEKNTTK